LQDEIKAKLQVLIDSRRVRQTDLARDIGISQSTLSRVLSKGYHNRSRARDQIEKYLSEHALNLHIDAVPPEVVAAVDAVWDKSDIHARELARIIRSLDGLRPRPIEQRDAGENRGS
jgi:hypothetical protein